MPFSGASDMASVGEAVHRFLAADDPSRHNSWRVALASRLLDAWGVTCLDPRHVVEMGTRFRGFVAGRWPQAVVSREAPILYRVGDRTMSGRLDVVVETPDAIIVVDHKSFPRPHAVARAGEEARRTVAPLRRGRRCVAADAEDGQTSSTPADCRRGSHGRMRPPEGPTSAADLRSSKERGRGAGADSICGQRQGRLSYLPIPTLRRSLRI